MQHLKTVDGKEQTVIALQVENEPGICGSDRDYGPEAQTEYNSPVPAKLITAMNKAGKGKVYDIWQQAGGGKNPAHGPNCSDGKARNNDRLSMPPLLMKLPRRKVSLQYSDVHQCRFRRPGIPGERYSSGAAVAKTIDIYTWFAPYLDLFAPDNFGADNRTHELANAPFATESNRCLSLNPPNLNGCSTISLISTPSVTLCTTTRTKTGNSPEHARRVLLTRSVAAAVPLLLKYQGQAKSKPSTNRRCAASAAGRHRTWTWTDIGDHHVRDGHLKEMANEPGTVW